jgi:hypothetical protein
VKKGDWLLFRWQRARSTAAHVEKGACPLFSLLCLTLAVAGCKCGGGAAAGPQSVERVIPLNARVAVIVPSVDALGDKLTLLEGLKVANFVAQAQNIENAHVYVDALVTQLGIDVRSKEQMEKLGIAHEASAGAAFMDENSALLALPVKQEGRLAAFLRTFAQQRLGATTVQDKEENGVMVHRIVGPADDPRLAWVVTNGYALVTSGKSGIEKLSTWASRPEQETLAKDPALPASLARLPAQRDAIIYVPPGSRAILGGPVSSVALAFSLTPQALSVSADAPWTGDKAALAAFSAKAGPELLPLLPADAFLVARLGGEASAISAYLEPLLGERLVKALDLRKELLDLVQPGAVVGLSLAPTVQMGGGLPELDVRRTNPFTYVHLSGAAAAKSADAVGPALEKLAAAGPKIGAQIEKRERNGHDVYVSMYAQGEGIHFAGVGDKVLFGSPMPRLDALMAADGKGPGPVPDAKLKALLESSGLGLVIDLRKLSASVRELPASAWGIGGFAIKASTLRWLDATDDLKDVTLTVGEKQGALQGELKLWLGQ